jgi:hypothetical protein
VKDDAIGTIFPSESVEVRFVVSMSMAKNDIERALTDANACTQERRSRLQLPGQAGDRPSR